MLSLGRRMPPGTPMPLSAASRQRTLRRPLRCRGIGLHSGRPVTLTILPAGPDTGILFRRTDLPPGTGDIPARWDRVVDTRLCTVLGNDRGARVATVEHVLAALAGCEIDNAVIELNAPETPALDGSAAPIVDRIVAAGSVPQPAARRALRILEPIEIVEGSRRVALRPDWRSYFVLEIDFPGSLIGRQCRGFRMVPDAFVREIARARTFGFLEDVDRMRAAGLALGGSLDNAVVIDGDRVLNEGGLRYPDEFVRHKILDAVGDLYLAGAPVLGRFEGVQSGHALNNALLRRLFADPQAWCWIRLPATGSEALPTVATA